MLGKVYGTAFPAVCHDVNGRTGSTGDADHTSYLPKNDQKNTEVNQISKRNGQIFGKQETGC